jgi:hypothetical protein
MSWKKHTVAGGKVKNGIKICVKGKKDCEL